MVFSSVLFLCFFLPIVLAAYYLAPNRFRNLISLGASLLFYAWGAPSFVFVLVASSLMDYVCSRQLAASSSQTTRKLYLGVAVAINVIVFAYCKYAGFFVAEVNHALEAFSSLQIRWVEVIMPIGISFFTFHHISYLVDVYRGTAKVADNFANYLLYITFFPQLIAGPIIRYNDVAEQINHREHTSEKFLSGVWRFAIGLSKKVIIANSLCVVVDQTFGASQTSSVDPNSLSWGAAWIGAICFAMQLYFDFSGYSDMAIGLGKMFGFEFLENFDYPYTSSSVTEFWRRWHISLSNWMRDYLYIPMGGNRVSPARTYVNLWTVFLLSGLWHGASWNFVVWGAFHGTLLSIERFANLRKRWRPPTSLQVPLTFLLVLIGWVFFRAWNLSQGVHYLSAMFVPTDGKATESVTVTSLMNPLQWLCLAVAITLSMLPIFRKLQIENWTIAMGSRFEGTQLLVRASVVCLLLVANFSLLVSSSFNPFIYFRF